MQTSLHNLSTNNALTSALILRLSLGVILLAHGLLKLLVFTLEGAIGYFASLGFPPVLAVLTVVGEIALGISLIVGLYTRLSAILSLPILLGATWVHLSNGWLFSNQGGGWEFPLLLVVLAVVVALQGAGRLALGGIALLDRVIPGPLQA